MAIVLDASAVLALLQDEPGSDVVAAQLSTARICAVSWSEVLQTLMWRDLPVTTLADGLLGLGLSVDDFTRRDASIAADLARWREWGLSLADRACLAHALRLRATVYTADRAWAPFVDNSTVTISIVLIR